MNEDNNSSTISEEQPTEKKPRPSTLKPPEKMVAEEIQQQPPVQQPPPEPAIITKIADLQRMNIEEMNNEARKYGIKHAASLTKSQIVFEIVKAKSESPDELLIGEGVLEVLPDGFGFLRSPNYNYISSAEDIYVSPAQIRRFDLKKGRYHHAARSAPLKKKRNTLPC